MNIDKPRFWDYKYNFLTIILLPISYLVLVLIFLKKKLKKEIKFKIPVICIGNIYIGGTGKTPTSIFLAKELNRQGKKTAIVRKFYKNHKDEHKLIKNSFKDLILAKKRSLGIFEAEKNYNTVILDDGFQEYKIFKNLNIICFNSNQLAGNEYVLPAGPLRESLANLNRAHIILINGSKNKKFEDKLLSFNKNLSIFYSKYKPKNLEQFKNKKLLAFAGIGNPYNFFKLLKHYGLKIEKQLTFPDHYVFSPNEVGRIVEEAKNKNLEIITTEKDYYKIEDYGIKEIQFLKVDLEIDDKEKLLKEIQKYL